MFARTKFHFFNSFYYLYFFCLIGCVQAQVLNIRTISLAGIKKSMKSGKQKAEEKKTGATHFFRVSATHLGNMICLPAQPHTPHPCAQLAPSLAIDVACLFVLRRFRHFFFFFLLCLYFIPFFFWGFFFFYWSLSNFQFLDIF